MIFYLVNFVNMPTIIYKKVSKDDKSSNIKKTCLVELTEM